MKPKPHFFYKYRPFDRHAESWILRTQVFLSSPSRLNDPFDSKANLSYTATEKDKTRFFANRSFLKTLPKRERWEVARKIVASGALNPGNKLEQAESIQEVIDRKGMLCLSSRGDDILMFAHYAGGHTGYCLQYRNQSAFQKAEEVTYSSTYPEISFYRTPETEIAKLVCLTKAEQWQYECEWRFFVNAEGLYTCEEELLVGITFGCLMSDAHKKEIVEMNRARKFPAKLFQAVKHPSRYSLEIIPLKK